TMGGAVFYTPDITAPAPRWREVFDDTAAFRSLFPTNTPTAGGDVGSWIQVSPDDGLLYHVVMGGGPMSPPEYEAAGMMYVLDIRPLLRAGSRTRCSIDDLAEVETGGVEKDCPKLVSALPIFDETSGGPHWAAMDNFTRGPDGRYRETSQIRRLALSNYFVARAQIDGDHRVCLIDVDRHGRLSLDRTFRDEHTGAACVHFDRDRWPHGAGGAAQPHGVLFTVADRDLR
ncbi:MAG TPA: hypothetical protein VFT95_18160, partial [Micromonosporaceae bacterium]|nr:hypothetical protein [Micromonosporaceae bacterium]